MQVQVKIEIPVEIEDRLRKVLRRGGLREIGGIIMGECLESGRFRIVDFTVDLHGGTVTSFVRSLRGVLHALSRFFNLTAHDYRRFNYLGEWHSHPSFFPFPSSRDIKAGQSIADDPDVGANFIVLLIVKFSEEGVFEGSATIFKDGAPPEAAKLVLARDRKHVREAD